jgi:V/A-type H+-transporting ATPase subunit I
MSLDPVSKVEITAHTSIIDGLLEELQELAIIQIDPHRVEEWESEKSLIADTADQISELKREILDVERALHFLDGHKPKVSILQRLSTSPDSVSKDGLREFSDAKNATRLMENALESERELSNVDSTIRDLRQKKEELQPFEDFNIPLSLLIPGEKTEILISRLDQDAYKQLENAKVSELVHVGRIRGGEEEKQRIPAYLEYTVYFFIIYHIDAREEVQFLERDYRFEPLALQMVDKKPVQLIEEYEKEIQELEKTRKEIMARSQELASELRALKYYSDYLQIELEKETQKEKFFYTEKVFVINGWIKERDLPKLRKVVDGNGEAFVSEVAKDDDDSTPVAYRNNPVVSPFEIIVNLYSPPHHKEVDPTPVLMPFYALFFGICLTDAGYGLVVALIALVGMLLIKQKTPFRKFLSMFFILGAVTFVIGALIGSVFGINFDMLPQNLVWLREARYKIMIFDSGKEVLKLFALSLALGVLHLIAGYLIKIFILIRSGDWVEAVCEHLPWIFLLLAPVPKILIGRMPEHEPTLNLIFYGLLALWALILLFFSERSSWNPVKRIGKGIFTLYGVSGVLADVLSYSRLLALGLATGVIAGVMNTLAGMVREIPIIGIIGFVGVLLIGHIFNLFISGLSAFVHSIRLQFMEFFTKFYTGGGELLQPFSEKRNYSYVQSEQGK